MRLDPCIAPLYSRVSISVSSFLSMRFSITALYTWISRVRAQHPGIGAKDPQLGHKLGLQTSKFRHAFAVQGLWGLQSLFMVSGACEVCRVYGVYRIYGIYRVCRVHRVYRL